MVCQIAPIIPLQWPWQYRVLSMRVAPRGTEASRGTLRPLLTTWRRSRSKFAFSHVARSALLTTSDQALFSRSRSSISRNRPLRTLRQKMLSLGIHTLLLWAAFQSVLAQDDEFPGKIDCYSWTGQIFQNNTQCSGSRICCQTADFCDPNRFCVQNGQHVVPACAVFPWSDCANICQYGTSPSHALPRYP